MRQHPASYRAQRGGARATGSTSPATTSGPPTAQSSARIGTSRDGAYARGAQQGIAQRKLTAACANLPCRLRYRRFLLKFFDDETDGGRSRSRHEHGKHRLAPYTWQRALQPRGGTHTRLSKKQQLTPDYRHDADCGCGDLLVASAILGREER